MQKNKSARNAEIKKRSPAKIITGFFILGVLLIVSFVYYFDKKNSDVYALKVNEFECSYDSENLDLKCTKGLLIDNSCRFIYDKCPDLEPMFESAENVNLFSINILRINRISKSNGIKFPEDLKKDYGQSLQTVYFKDIDGKIYEVIFDVSGRYEIDKYSEISIKNCGNDCERIQEIIDFYS